MMVCKYVGYKLTTQLMDVGLARVSLLCFLGMIMGMDQVFSAMLAWDFHGDIYQTLSVQSIEYFHYLQLWKRYSSAD